jgi:hypothetical protein
MATYLSISWTPMRPLTDQVSTVESCAGPVHY